MPNIFKETSDHAMHLRDVLKLRIKHQESMIQELDTIHIATLGISRLGLSTIDEQRHRQVRMMDFAIDQMNALTRFFTLRMDSEVDNMMHELSIRLCISKGDVIRHAIRALYKSQFSRHTNV